jgi:hypothetical protein
MKMMFLKPKKSLRDKENWRVIIKKTKIKLYYIRIFFSLIIEYF